MLRAHRLLERIIARLLADECADLAAQMSFYFVLSLVPFFLVLAAIVGWLPSTDLWQAFVQWISTYLPMGSRRLIISVILDLTNGYTKFLSFGLLATIWSASSGFVSLMEALSIAHGAKDTRSFWRKRILAIVSTLASAVFFLLGFTLTALGHDAAISLSYFYRDARLAHSSLFWETLRWIANLVLILVAINLVNHFLPDVKRPWRWLTPGTSFVALTFISASVCFNFYVRHSSNISRIYGALAGVIIFMLWIYMSSLILLIGAETDTAIRELAQESVVA
jgi:membrane protein